MRTVRAEWTKLRTVASTGWLLCGVVAVTLAVSAAVDAVGTCTSSAGCHPDLVKLSLTGTQAGQAVVAILATLAVTAEYGTGMIRTTLAAMPWRTAVLAAKAAVVAGLALAAGTVAVLGSVLAGWLILPGRGLAPARGYPAPTLAQLISGGPVLRAAAGTALYLVLIALLSLGIAAAVRDTAAAIGIVLGLLYLVPILSQVAASPGWQRHLDQLGPTTAGLAIQASADLGSQPVAPWTGLGVLAAWAAAALAAGGLVLRLCDA